MFVACLLAFGGIVNAATSATGATNAPAHWAFQPLRPVPIPASVQGWPARTPVDRFVQARLAAEGLEPSPPAPRETLARRLGFLVTGLPPTPGELEAFLADASSDALERLTERWLASPRHGERWGKFWLDAAGYADSNGYFSADSDRPLAFRYRDYVVRSLNRDKPWDAFVREQLAGDELAGWRPDQPATPEIIELLEATHFLRNGQDGTGESDGNPDEVRVDRYYALEASMQIVGSSLLGLTLQCAKCHDHKFEPFTQQDYYAFQAFLYPALNIERWSKPNERVVEAALPGQRAAWEEQERRLDAEEAALRREFAEWSRSHRPPGEVLFEDAFDDPALLTERWSNMAPGDDAPGGSPPVQLGSTNAPAARVADGRLEIREGGGSGDRWISTRHAFDWRPARSNAWIQVTFDLVALRVGEQGSPADRVGWLFALHDFNDNGKVDGGNLLVDGNPGGASAVHGDYPGADSRSRGSIGAQGYAAGRNYGARITHLGRGQFRLEHLVDGLPDGATLTLAAEDLPPGGFGFEYCCGRSFVVDHVRIEASRDDDPAWAARFAEHARALSERSKQVETARKEIAARRTPRPGRIAWVSDAASEAPSVRFLRRGNPKTPGDEVTPAFPEFLERVASACDVAAPPAPTAVPVAGGTGRRLAWAQWLTRPGSPQSALLARVTVNRVWQQYFGAGLVATPDNLGNSGARPTHPELLEWLAGEFVRSGWSLKSLHRLLLGSWITRQSSLPHPKGIERDAADRWLWRFPLRRLDAEAIRDGMLAVSGRLGPKMDGPYVPTQRGGAGEVVVPEDHPEAFARSVFLQQRRSQVASFLGVFDAPSLVFNCSRRERTTMPLQALGLLNAPFVVHRASDLARRLDAEVGYDPDARLDRAFRLVLQRPPDPEERRLARNFLASLHQAYPDAADGPRRVWSDFCQSLLACNGFLYLE